MMNSEDSIRKLQEIKITYIHEMRAIYRLKKNSGRKWESMGEELTR